ncbi:alpha-ketoglutarate-dependent dioxygenase alkB homolog 7, mitochondrial [Danio rerio]|uniref:Alpha-ketoglutarate-dependent dioxygenase alkB homolog 7, mitochondrial n=1 Tax=Danio rerio TaxID=7955 RepID=Q566X4_DANRE|nr:alpha-ketoglutarate-dependent dioxygenase alkB homolog 7, mitochondrial [Danio rerio]AAH93288.1 Zgc:112404 [Danio rerio]|eukprot:NP_001017609.1 alpha-ketoglutarate-dependent dioxygenase alkB homolog 7, mitochondrial [Danio rerio]
MTLLIRVSRQIQRKSLQNTSLYRIFSESSALRKGPECTDECKWLCGSSEEILSAVRGQVEVRQNFISEEEENALFKEVEAGLRKKRYEFDHWDDAIHGYRETERLQWGAASENILRRVRTVAFPEGSPLLGPVHVLDLDKKGYIKPHIDSVKFCGSTIAGLSLLSDSIMRLVPENNTTDRVDLLLSRRSLYILRDDARFKFTHEILKDEESFFSGQKVPRHRRISVICRNLPM